MQSFESVLTAAQGLPAGDRLPLVDALWDTVPPECEAPFSEEWEQEIERRVAELDEGAATIPWVTIREAALARIGRGPGN
jgi:putative addiction module component (TIGR02574 family)